MSFSFPIFNHIRCECTGVTNLAMVETVDSEKVGMNFVGFVALCATCAAADAVPIFCTRMMSKWRVVSAAAREQAGQCSQRCRARAAERDGSGALSNETLATRLGNDMVCTEGMPRSKRSSPKEVLHNVSHHG